MRKAWKVFAVLALCVVSHLSAPAFGGQEALPPIMEAVIQNRDFFALPAALWGCDDYALCDVNRLNDERIGLTCLTPLGYTIWVVYDIETLKILYREERIDTKGIREAMRRGSVSVADAKKLARGVAQYQMKNPKK